MINSHKRFPAAAFVAVAILMSNAVPVAADAPGYADTAPSYAPRRLAHRPLPPASVERGRGYGPYGGPPAYGPVVRAYLPRNDNVPMYNEPPAR